MKDQPSLAPISRRNWLKTLALASLADPNLFAAQSAHLAPQAWVARSVRQGSAGFDPQRPASDWNDRGPEAVPRCTLALQIPAARTERHVAE